MRIPDLVSYHAQMRPNAGALLAPQRSIAVSWRQLDRRSNRFAAWLMTQGVAKGDKIGLFLDNQWAVETVIAYLGVHKIGAVNVPINTRLRGHELSFIMAQSTCRRIITSREGQRVLSDIGVDDGFEVHLVEEWDWNGEQDAVTIPWELRMGDEADFLFTSGTTGKPKATVHTHFGAMHLAISAATAISLSDADIYQTAIPFYSSSGCHTYLLPALFAGVTMVIDPAFDVHDTIRTMRNLGTTVYFGVPAMLLLLLGSDEFRGDLLSRWRLCLYGGSIMPYDAINKIRRRFPGVGLINFYGLTEAGPGGTMLDDRYALEKIGAVGRPIPPFTEIRVVDSEEKDLPVGEVGEIYIHTPSAMVGYFHNPEETAKINRNGWIATGDLGRLDEDGILYIVDRKKDIVIRGGFNIYPSEIEQIIYEHPAVLEAAVVGVPHPILGQDTHAFVVAKPNQDITREDLLEFLRDRIADFKIPRRVTFVSALPRNAMGKVQKQDLRALLERERSEEA
ncbi:MAG: AMP-binding protein [Firmicutes bacterium]|nr:AMP-binding protein [Bacillota bacterium]